MEETTNKREDMNKVDKLFKDKLAEHSIQPSAQAWEKVEAHLGKKNRMVVWLRVAAALAVMGLLTFVVVNRNRNYEETKQELVTTQEVTKDEVIKDEGTKIPATTDETPKAQSTKVKKQTAGSKVIIPAIEQPVEQIAVETGVRSQEPGDRSQESGDRSQKTEDGRQKTEAGRQTKKGITLTYSLPSIKKPESPAEPLIADEKKTAFERVLQIAKEVKNGDNALGDLREAKDQIFALDFKKDKDKSKKQ
jgi:cytoskeletal protein RodZ